MNLDDLTSFPGIHPGSTFLIAGGTGAIGSRCARVLCQIGARVAVLGRLPQRVHHVVADLDAGAAALGVVGDISDAASSAAAVGSIIARWGQLDGLINSAAVGDGSTDIFHVTEDEIDTVLRTNVRGALLLARAAADVMRRQRRGRIVNVSSIAAHRVQRAGSVYGTSKAAVAHLTRHLAVELGPFGITANSVSPGQTPTPSEPL